MESPIEETIHNLLNTLTNQAFKGVESLFNRGDMLQGYSHIFGWSQLFVWFSIVVILLFSVKRAIYFARENGEGIKGYVKENRVYFIQLLVLFLISLFPNAILHFTYNVFGSLVEEESVFQMAKDVTGQMEGGVISVILIKLTTVGALLFVALLQLIEVFSLTLVLFLSPIVLFVSLFNRNIFNQFIRVFIQGILSPVTQAVLLLFMFQHVLPIILQESELPVLFQTVFLLCSLWFAYSGAGLFVKQLFVEKEDSQALLFK